MVGILRPNYARAIRTPIPISEYRKVYKLVIREIEEKREVVWFPWWATPDKLEAIFPFPALGGGTGTSPATFQEFVASGTFNAATGTVRVKMIGGGGHGAAGTGLIAGGGGGGGASVVHELSISGPVAVTIGAAANTSFGSLIASKGENAGFAGAGSGGPGGVATVGVDSSAPGGNGGEGLSRRQAGGGGGGAGWFGNTAFSGSNAPASSNNGGGGFSPGGNGGRGDYDQTISADQWAENGFPYGGGGGGDSDQTGPIAGGSNHGLGAPGFCRVEW
jgi:hypothetical protein